MDVQWIIEGLKKPGKSKKGLAAALGRFPSAISDILAQRRQIRAGEISIIADYLEVHLPAERAIPKETVPLVGYVGAGAETHTFADGQGSFDYVDAPPTNPAHFHLLLRINLQALRVCGKIFFCFSEINY